MIFYTDDIRGIQGLDLILFHLHAIDTHLDYPISRGLDLVFNKSTALSVASSAAIKSIPFPEAFIWRSDGKTTFLSAWLVWAEALTVTPSKDTASSFKDISPKEIFLDKPSKEIYSVLKPRLETDRI